MLQVGAPVPKLPGVRRFHCTPSNRAEGRELPLDLAPSPPNAGAAISRTPSAMSGPAVGEQKLNSLEGWAYRRLVPRPAQRHRIDEANRNLDADGRLGHSVSMIIAERIAQIDNHLAGAHLVLLDLASGHPVPGDGPAVKAALSDLEAARELLHGLAAGPGQN